MGHPDYFDWLDVGHPRPSFVLKAEEWGCAHHCKGARNAHPVGVWIYFANVIVPKRPLA